MKQFVFSLQSFYEMQEGIEKQLKLQMSAIEAELALHIRELEALNASFDNTKTEYAAAVSRGIQAMKIGNYGLFFDKLRAVILIQQGKIAKLEAEKAKCLQNLIEVRREKMLLDKLREEQYAQYMDGVKKHQAKVMDDFVSYTITDGAAKEAAQG